MKAEIHPAYKDATITCACGAVHKTRSTRGSFTTDVCSQCHPFYTGKHKIMDVAGRVDRFRRKYANATKPAAAKPAAAPEAAAPDTAEK
jgi:large subunit ribosomal protein L31